MAEVQRLKKVQAYFFSSETGREPVRDWLMTLEREDRREVGRALMTLEYGWPMGMPLARAMGQGLHELRVDLARSSTARIFFYIDRQERLVLLHAFFKRTRATPQSELQLARQRMYHHQRSTR